MARHRRPALAVGLVAARVVVTAALFAGAVVVDTVVVAPGEGIALALLAFAALSMAAAVVGAMARSVEARS